MRGHFPYGRRLAGNVAEELARIWATCWPAIVSPRTELLAQGETFLLELDDRPRNYQRDVILLLPVGKLSDCFNDCLEN